MSRSIAGTVAETYLRNRGITALHGTANLRFHPRCYYRPYDDAPTQTWPAMIAAVTDFGGEITGAHRTWLDPSGEDKAPIDTPRRAMGQLLGNAVRFDMAQDVMAAGEGIETVLSLRCVMPDMPMVAALSAAHMAAILFPVTLRRLYIVRDNDAAGDGAAASLIDRAKAARNRGDRFVADAGGLQRGSPRTRRRCATDGDQGATRAAGRRPLHGIAGVNRNGETRRGGARV